MATLSPHVSPVFKAPGPVSGQWLVTAWTAFVDGLAALRRFRHLTALSNSELARQGLTRDDVVRQAVLGDK